MTVIQRAMAIEGFGFLEAGRCSRAADGESIGQRCDAKSPSVAFIHARLAAGGDCGRRPDRVGALDQVALTTGEDELVPMTAMMAMYAWVRALRVRCGYTWRKQRREDAGRED